MSIITVDEIREFASDYSPNNYLIDGEEFSDTYISMCLSLALDSFNTLVPVTRFTMDTMPSKTVMLWGTLWQMFEGKAVLLARNTMNYSDGGLQIPIEERSELYKSLANGFHQNFDTAGKALKIQMNMESGWGSVSSDNIFFPEW
jgi:hypothetical protein